MTSPTLIEVRVVKEAGHSARPFVLRAHYDNGHVDCLRGNYATSEAAEKAAQKKLRKGAA